MGKLSNPGGLRTLLLLIPPMFLLLPVSILTFILERVSQSILLAQTLKNWRSGSQEITFYGPTTTGSTDYTYTDLVLLTNQAPTIAIIIICWVAFTVAVLGICGTWELRRIEGTSSHQRSWCWTMLVVNALMMGASIGVLAYASSVQAGQKGWQSYEDVKGMEDERFTRETWTCQINKFYPKQDWAGAACGISKATRFMLIPMLIASALVMVSTWILVRDRGGLKWLIGGKGRYGGFASVYEMPPPVPVVAYVQQPVQMQQAATYQAPHPATPALQSPQAQQKSDAVVTQQTVFR